MLILKTQMMIVSYCFESRFVGPIMAVAGVRGRVSRQNRVERKPEDDAVERSKVSIVAKPSGRRRSLRLNPFAFVQI